jgi:hypothetical protein
MNFKKKKQNQYDYKLRGQKECLRCWKLGRILKEIWINETYRENKTEENMKT